VTDRPATAAAGEASPQQTGPTGPARSAGNGTAANHRAPMRVLLIGINYWPEETGIAPYTTGLAEHLAARGHETTVLTGVPHYPQWRVLESYAGRLRTRERLRGVQVRRFRHYVPGRQSALRRALYEGTFLLNALATTQPSRPDVIMGVVPSLTGGVLAAIAARRYGVPYGLLFQDVMGQAAQQSGVPGGRRVERLTRSVESRIARGASGIAVVAEGFRSYLESLGVPRDRIHRVRNWTHIAEPHRRPQETRALLGLPADARICLHAGNMGLKQGLDALIECAALAWSTDRSLCFVLAGDGSQRAQLQSRAAGLPNVFFLSPQPEEIFPDMLAAADVLLLTQRPSVTDMALPSKLTSYMAAGRPVVAAVSSRSEAAFEIRASGAGVLVSAGRPAELLAAVRAVVNDTSCARSMGLKGQEYAREHYGGEAALRRLEEIVTQLLPAPSSGSTRSAVRTAWA